MRARISLALALLVVGCSDGASLEVVLVTDLRAELDFRTARVELLSDDPSVTDPLASAPSVMLSANDDLLGGRVISTLSGVAPGTYLVRVELVGDAGGVASGVTRVTIGSDTGRATLRILRSCLGVACPRQTCVAGACADPRCGPEMRAYCPPAECVEDVDCPASGPGCLRPICLGGACALYPDDALCSAGSCDPEDGCPLGSDAGTGDAGPAPVDAGRPDAGCAPTAEACNGRDDDCDGSIDNGDVCPCPVHYARGRAFLFCPTRAVWATAQASCRMVGYDLVTIDDSALATDLLEIARVVFTMRHWIGLSDQVTEGTFTWSDGSASPYRDWAVDQPDDWNMVEDCAEVDDIGAWNDIRCDVTHPYICGVP